MNYVDYENLEKEIIKLQNRLRKRNGNHPLLKLVDVDEGVMISWNADFYARYKDMKVYTGFKNYVKDLKKELYLLKDNVS